MVQKRINSQSTQAYSTHFSRIGKSIMMMSRPYIYVVLLLIGIAVQQRGIKADDEVFGPQQQTHSRTRRLTSIQPVKDTFARVQQKMNSAPGITPPVQNALQGLNDKVNNLTMQNVGNYAGQMLAVASSIENNWNGLTSGDGATIAKSVVDIVGSVGEMLPPPAGMIVSGFTGLISFFISIFGSRPSQQDIGAIIHKIISEQLNEQYKKEIGDRLGGATRKLTFMQTFTNEYIGKKLDAEDRAYLNTQINLFDQEELRGQIATIIKRTSKTSSDEEAKDTVNLVNSYVLISSMKEVLWQTMLSIYNEDPKLATSASASAITSIITKARGMSREDLQFLRAPAQGNAITVANYVPNNNPGIEIFMDAIGVSFPDMTSLTGGCHRMTSKRFNTHVMVLPSGLTLTNKNADRSAALQFAKSGNTWTISAPSGKFGFVDARSGQMGKRINIVRNAEQFRIYKFTDGGYMLLNEKWPTSPIWSHNIADVRVGCCLFDGNPAEYVYDLVPRGC